jgi:hypothetical protein
LSLAARTDGKNPPTKPIIIAKIRVEITILGESANEKDNSAKEL